MLNKIFANNIIFQELQTRQEVVQGKLYEKRIVVVFSKYRSLYIKLCETMYENLTTSGDRSTVNFCFSHNIQPKSVYSEVELHYPVHLSNIVSQCNDFVVKQILDLQ